MREFKNSIVELLIQCEAEALSDALDEAGIPDTEPTVITSRAYHEIGKRGSMDGSYYVRTLATFDLDEHYLDDAVDDDYCPKPLNTSQIFGVEKNGVEIPIVAIDFDRDNELEHAHDIDKVSVDLEVNNNIIKLIDIDSFTIHDMLGYEELCAVIRDIKLHGLKQNCIFTDLERMNLLIVQASQAVRKTVPQAGQYEHIIASEALRNYCVINTQRIGDHSKTNLVVGVAGSDREAHVSLIKDSSGVVAIRDPDIFRYDILRSLVRAKLIVRSHTSRR